MKYITLNNIELTTKVSFPLLKTTTQQVKSLTCQFEFGKAYCLDSDLAGGGWGISWLIAGKISKKVGDIFIDNIPFTQQQLKKNAMPVGLPMEGFFSSKRSVRQQILQGMRTHPILLHSNPNEYFKYFQLSEEKIDRTIENISAMRYRASAAIGFANGKKVFCFPWMEAEDIGNHFSNWMPDLISKLKENGCLIIIPTIFTEKMSTLFDERITV